MFDTSFQAHGLTVEVRFSVMLQGPSSIDRDQQVVQGIVQSECLPSNNPIIESLPGPPFNHSVMGSLFGSLLDSKNQKNVCTSSARLTKPE